jgi:hypothetical protein
MVDLANPAISQSTALRLRDVLPQLVDLSDVDGQNMNESIKAEFTMTGLLNRSRSCQLSASEGSA